VEKAWTASKTAAGDDDRGRFAMTALT